MGEVATVAAIAGGILSTGVTGLVTWRVSKNTASVELVKVAAENHRLQYGNREEERRNRQATYHKFLDVSVLIFQDLGTETTFSEFTKTLDEYNHLLSGVLLFGPAAVRDGALELNRVYVSIWPALAKEEAANPQKTDVEQWRDATSPLSPEFGAAMRELVRLMHGDVTKGIADGAR